MAIAAHDLRNPIAVVRASAQMAQRQLTRGDLDAARGRLTAIVEQTDRLTEIIETFLDAARIGARRLPMDRNASIAGARGVGAGARARHGWGTSAARRGCSDTRMGASGPGIARGSSGRCGRWWPTRCCSVIHPRQCGSTPFAMWSRRLSVSGGGEGPDDEEQQHLFERFFRGRSAANAVCLGPGSACLLRAASRRCTAETCATWKATRSNSNCPWPNRSQRESAPRREKPRSRHGALSRADFRCHGRYVTGTLASLGCSRCGDGSRECRLQET